MKKAIEIIPVLQGDDYSALKSTSIRSIFYFSSTFHPDRLLFWTDLGKQPRIERVSMDGLERKVVIDSSQLTWPNGLTIDYASDRIFWADSKRNLIGSSDLDGSDILIVARNIQNPSSLTVFEDSIYWTNDITGKAFQANKLTGSITHQYQITLYYPTDVKIIHPLRQKAGELLILFL